MARNTASLSVGLACTQLLTAIAYWLVARSSSPAEFGELAAYVGVAMLLSAVADLGFNAWLVRELARGSSQPLFSAGLGVRVAVAVGIGGAWLLATCGSLLVWSTPTYVPLLGLWITLSLLWSTLLVPLRAAERMHEVAAISALERVLLAGVTVAGCVVGRPSLALVLGLVAGAFVATLTALRSTGTQMRQVHRPRRSDLLLLFRSSSGFAISSLALQAQRVDVALVGAIAGPHAAGIYAAPARLMNALVVPSTAFSTALFPRASRDGGPMWTTEFRRGLAVVLAVMLGVVVPLFAFSDSVVPVVLGEEYQSSADVLRVLLIGSVLASLNQPIAARYQALGYERYVARVVAVGSALGLLTIGLGACLAGARGAAYGFAVLQVAILLPLVVRTLHAAPAGQMQTGGAAQT